MLASGIPAKFPIPWAYGAGGAYIRSIPEASQIGVQAGAASLTDGFPPVTFLPLGSGGTPPFGQDANGILNQITLWSQWQQAGGPVSYDSAFSSAIGGYPKGALLLAAAGNYWWLSTADNNTSDPDTGGSNWTYVPLASGFPVTLFGVSTSMSLAGATYQGNNVLIQASGTTQTLPTASWNAGETVGFSALFACTINLTGGAVVHGGALSGAT